MSDCIHDDLCRPCYIEPDYDLCAYYEQRRGKCTMRLRDDLFGHAYQDIYECSECGGQMTVDTCIGESEPPDYCPWCGREVSDE